MEESIFNDSSDERVKMAEIITLDWIGQHWEQIEDMFENVRNCKQNTILVNFSTLKTHEEKISESYKTIKNTFSRLRGFTHHSEDFLPNVKCPLIMIQDPDLNEPDTQESGLIDSFIAESLETCFIIIQTTKDVGKISKFGHNYWISLPKVVLKQDTLYKTNCVGEVASLIFFGELRYRGIFSHMWSTFHYNEIENLSNRRFAHIVRESLVSPFYLSPTISEDAVFMGFGYEEYKPQIVKRKLSPVRRKRLNVPTKTLKSKPTITRPPSPPRKPTITRPPSPPRKPKRVVPENEKSSPPEGEDLGISPSELSDTEDSEIESKPESSFELEEESVPKKGKKTIINPKTGRKVFVGGSTYINLVEKGIIHEKSEET